MIQIVLVHRKFVLLICTSYLFYQDEIYYICNLIPHTSAVHGVIVSSVVADTAVAASEAAISAAAAATAVVVTAAAAVVVIVVADDDESRLFGDSRQRRPSAFGVSAAGALAHVSV